MRRQQKFKVMKDMMKKIRSRGRMDAENPQWVAELLAADCDARKLGSIQERKKPCKNGMFGWRKVNMEDEKRKMENKG